MIDMINVDEHTYKCINARYYDHKFYI